jgi:predicted ester cyclase
MSVDALIDAFEQAWPGDGPARFDALCAEDVHYEDPLLDDPITGPRALARHADRLLAAFPDARVESTGPRMTSGRHVSAPCKLVAHHRGPLGDIPPTGRFVRVHAVVVSELHPERDVLWRVRAFLDAYGAGVELGILPRRGSLGEKALRTLQGFGARAGRQGAS